MLERHLHFVRTERPDPAETAATARTRLGEKFPRAALRRMTHLGMLLGSTLDGLVPGTDDAVVYATTYAETRALEDYLASFPAASPLLFQTSIHPGAVQQVMIGRQQPLSRFWPLTGRARLTEHALLTAVMETAPRVLLLGGEERGTWLLENNMASDRSFAFAVSLTRDATGAAACVRFTPSPTDSSFDIRLSTPNGDNGITPCPSLAAFTDALAARAPLHWRSPAGEWSLTWS